MRWFQTTLDHAPPIGGRCVLSAIAVVASLVVMTPCVAQSLTPQSPTPWTSLTPAQRHALEPLERDWSRIDRNRQQKWLDVASRFDKLPSDDRERVQQRMADWSRMSPDERSRARLNYQELRSETGPDERQSRWQSYQALPESQKRELAKRANVAPAQQPQPTRAARIDGTKSAVVNAPNPLQASPKSVTPTLVQTAPGATTNLVTQVPKPPMHQQAGLPKMTAKPGFVDQKTLLPKRGMQGAAIAAQTDAPDTIKRQ